MQDFRFNYIITIHNKQDLIGQVMEGLIACCKEGSYIYPVLDGCTDNTEKIIDGYIQKYPGVPIIKLYAPDVHELKTINTGLRGAVQSQKGCNIILQDDVVIQEPELESIVKKIYDHFGYSNVGYLSFRHGVNIYLKDKPEISEIFRKKFKVIEERDVIESAYGTHMSPFPLNPHYIVERMATVGSPQCISCEAVSKLGVMDEQMAPVSWSCHDMSLRCLEAGLHNYTFALKFQSDVDWGGTRTNPNPKHMAILARNQAYLYEKHKTFLERFSKSKDYRRLKLAKPFLIPGLKVSAAESKRAIKDYNKRRLSQIGLKIHLIAKYIKVPLKKILIHSHLY